MGDFRISSPRFAQAPGLRGPMGLMANVIEKIDSSKLTELIVTDVGAMMLPRMVIEYKERGIDMFRETFIREVLGTIDSSFFPGILGFLVMPFFQASWMPEALRNRLNPKRVNLNRWIQNHTLTTLGSELSAQIAATHNTTTQDVVQRFVKSLVNGLESTDGMAFSPVFRKFAKAPVAGRLLPQTAGHMAELLAVTPTASARRFEAIQKQLIRLAEMGELGGEVQLKNAVGKSLIPAMSRDGLLKEIQSFMAEVAGRVLPRESQALTTALRKQILGKLNGKASGLSLLPAKAQGMIPYLQRTKWFVSLMPLAIAVAISISISWFNRWYTQKKNGGEVFFPGEQIFKQPQGGKA